MRNEILVSKINFDDVCDVMLSHWKDGIVETALHREIK